MQEKYSWTSQENRLAWAHAAIFLTWGHSYIEYMGMAADPNEWVVDLPEEVKINYMD